MFALGGPEQKHVTPIPLHCQGKAPHLGGHAPAYGFVVNWLSAFPVYDQSLRVIVIHDVVVALVNY